MQYDLHNILKRGTTHVEHAIYTPCYINSDKGTRYVTWKQDRIYSDNPVVRSAHEVASTLRYTVSITV